jgi:hypothetical protein
MRSSVPLASHRDRLSRDVIRSEAKALSPSLFGKNEKPSCERGLCFRKRPPTPATSRWNSTPPSPGYIVRDSAQTSACIHPNRNCTSVRDIGFELGRYSRRLSFHKPDPSSLRNLYDQILRPPSDCLRATSVFRSGDSCNPRRILSPPVFTPGGRCVPGRGRCLPQLRGRPCTPTAFSPTLRPASQNPLFPSVTHRRVDLPAQPRCPPAFPPPRSRASRSPRAVPLL